MKWYAFLQAMNTTMLHGNKKPEVNFIIKNIFDKKNECKAPCGGVYFPLMRQIFL